MHDLIGDIHGHADALQQLLKTLGYERQHGVYRHPDRQAIFLGDFIDRGPKIHETLEIVRPMVPIESDLPLPDEVIQAAVPYPSDAKPVFVGHYWMRAEHPQLLRQNIACVDWSVAKGGFLCAYRWDGEQELDAMKFVWNR
jgi:hypothetical protein